MYETIAIATLLVLLAITGADGNHPASFKTCKIGVVASALTDC